MKGVLLLCVGAVLLQLGCSQDACERLTLGDLGDTTQLATTGVLSVALTPDGDSGGATLTSVRVMEMKIVCEAQHQMQDRYRYTSVVVRFDCDSTDDRVANCSVDGQRTNLVQQFDFGCVNGEWVSTILNQIDYVRTINPTATLNTVKDSGCNLCINPDHPSVSLVDVDSVTHCVDCASSCSEGLQRCYSTPGDCCSYFYQNMCVRTCPGILTGDNDDFECRCVELSADNGVFNYTDGQNVGSVATLDCNDGYEESVSTATCMESGWTATPMCNRVDCNDVTPLENGEISYSDGTFAGSVVTYTCDTGFFLEGMSMRMCQNTGVWTDSDPTCTPCSDKISNCEECTVDSNGDVTCTLCVPGYEYIPADQECKEITGTTDAASSCGTGCIIAIVLSIIALIVIAIVLTVVAFVLYKYLSDPATKLAQTGAGGLNGVARDNPLYVDPATVTDEGIDGVENGVTETTPLES